MLIMNNIGTKFATYGGQCLGFIISIIYK